jgi:hypothetical protein
MRGKLHIARPRSSGHLGRLAHLREAARVLILYTKLGRMANSINWVFWIILAAFSDKDFGSFPSRSAWRKVEGRALAARTRRTKEFVRYSYALVFGAFKIHGILRNDVRVSVRFSVSGTRFWPDTASRVGAAPATPGPTTLW